MKNHLALWAGISSFFATLIGLGVIDIFNPTDQIRLFSGIFVGLVTGGAVYSKQRLDDEKKKRVLVGNINIRIEGDKKIYSLELRGDPEELEDKQEVMFKVNQNG